MLIRDILPREQVAILKSIKPRGPGAPVRHIPVH